ncbi:MAG: ATP-binding protein [Desulfobacteraceae bacterium]|nr:ATP-binding protein [Desulfobacteraceae bacterium]
MTSLKKLPLGVQALETFKRDNCLYVDKTEHVLRMINEGMFYFLARPRRFGKSLLVSVLKCLFQAEKDMFEGLRIAEPGRWEWKKHPVIVIDFNEITHDTPENLRLSLAEKLVHTAQLHGIKLESSLAKGKFGELIFALRQKTGMPAVILADEYDKPIIDHLGKGDEAMDIARANRDILKSFFGVLKGTDVSPMLRFVFITGISKFSRVSIFSELNNLNDITMNPRYADMLGYTREELETCFKDRISRFAEETGCPREQIISELRHRYNGYRFSKKNIKVYNPFSVLKAFAESDFGNYWFETGTPSFLVNLLREKHYHLPEIEKMEVAEQVFSTYDIDCLKPEALLFQTGYVTIQDIQDDIYTLGYPNEEVKNAFLKYLLFSFTQDISGTEASRFLRISGYLRKEDFESFFETVTAIFASIPYNLNTKRDEAYFHTLFYLMISASGTDAGTEVLTCRGRIDLVAEFADKIYIMEFKCNQSAEAAIKQIREKGYAEKYKQGSKKIILTGINFSTEKRIPTEWKTEEEFKGVPK